MHHAKLSILLCEDMDEFSRTFKEQQDEYFNVEVCNDIHALCSRLRALDKEGKLPDILMLDLFAKRASVPEDASFYDKRREVDEDVHCICSMLRRTGERAREVLHPHGIDYLRIIRNEYPEYRLPILLYSRLGPYILHTEEAAAVDEYNSEFLLKWLDHDEQRKKIERFFSKWRSQDKPIALEISRKLSTLPAPLAAEVALHLKHGKFESAAKDGFLILDKFLKTTLDCSRDGWELSQHMYKEILRRGRPRKGEDERYFRNRVKATSDLYYSIYVLKRNFFAHNKKEEEWREVDMCLSVYNLIWREVEQLISNAT